MTAPNSSVTVVEVGVDEEMTDVVSSRSVVDGVIVVVVTDVFEVFMSVEPVVSSTK